MQHPFIALQPGYQTELAAMRVLRPTQVEEAVQFLLPKMDLYVKEQNETKVPAVLLAALDYREDNANPARAIGQGDPWNRVSVHVPRGHGPWTSKFDADVHYIRYDHLDDNSAPWSWPYACWKGEAWNGFGPRAHGIHTGYLWAGTSVYTRGKYVADGQWDPTVIDQQLGIIPVMKRLIALRPALAFGPVIDQSHVISVAAPQTPPHGVGGVFVDTHDTRWLQQALDACYLPSADALLVDGSYGRRTREAVRSFQRFNKLVPDGLYGPDTDKALTAALKQHQGVTQ